MDKELDSIPLKSHVLACRGGRDNTVKVVVTPQRPPAPTCPGCSAAMSFDELYEGGFIFECKECIPPGSQKALSWIGAGKRERATWPEWRLLKAALLIAEEHWEGKAKRQGVGGETSAAAFREMRLRIF